MAEPLVVLGTAILLVDGVGRPKIHMIPDALVPPNVIAWGHPQRARNERQVIVQFDRTRDERDPDGRPVYRMRGSGTPEIRMEPDYLRKAVIRSEPKLRTEGPCNGD